MIKTAGMFSHIEKQAFVCLHRLFDTKRSVDAIILLSGIKEGLNVNCTPKGLLATETSRIRLKLWTSCRLALTTECVDYWITGTIVCLIAAILFYPDLLNWVRPLLPAVLIARCCMRIQFRLQFEDYVAFCIVLTVAARAFFDSQYLGVGRATVISVAILVYSLTRTLSGRRLGAVVVPCCLTILVAVRSLHWSIITMVWVNHAISVGLVDITAAKATLISPMNGLINDWASFLTLSLTLATVSVFEFYGNRSWRMVSIAACSWAVLLVALLLCLSRAGYVAIATILAISLTYLVFLRSRDAIAISLLLTVLAVIGVRAVNEVTAGAVTRTALIRSTESQRRSLGARSSSWVSAAHLGRERWLAGSGLGTYAMRYIPSVGANPNSAPLARSLSAPLTIFVEEGAIGVFLNLAMLCAVVFRLIWTALDGQREELTSKVLLLAGLVGFWLKEMTFSSLPEEQTESCAIAVTYWIILGLLVNSPHRKPTSHRRPRQLLRCIVTVMVLISLLASEVLYRQIRRDRAEALAIKAVLETNSGDTLTASAFIREAIEIEPSPYYLDLQAFMESRYLVPGFAPRRAPPLEMSVVNRAKLRDLLVVYDRAIAANPADDVNWNNRAWVRVALGDRPSDVIPDLLRAINLDPADPVYRIGLGILYDNLEETERASEQYAMALAYSPEVADSAFARDLESRTPGRLRTLVERAIAYLKYTSPNGPDVIARAHLGALYLTIENVFEAKKVLTGVVEVMPGLPRAWANLGRIYLGSGEVDDANECIRKAAFLTRRPDSRLLTLFSKVARARGDGELESFFSAQSALYVGKKVSRHSLVAGAIYKTHAVLADDIIPVGLLGYCLP